jgi:hypothetical protein
MTPVIHELYEVVANRTINATHVNAITTFTNSTILLFSKLNLPLNNILGYAGLELY